MKKKLILLATLFCTQILFAQEKTDKLLVKLLKQHPDKFAKILADPVKYRLQILYTQIDRDKNNQPTFKSYALRLNPAEYFYPASTVKFPACLLALEKLNQLKINGLNRKTVMLTDSAFGGQIRQTTDESNLDNGGLPTIEHYIKKILIVSDNIAFNRLYEFMGQEAFNDKLHEKGYKNIRIVHRLETAMTREQNKRSNPIIFRKMSPNTEGVGEAKIQDIYRQPMLTASKNYEPTAPIMMGKGFMRGNTLVNEPFDFTYKNYYALAEQQAILRGLLFPESVPAVQRFDLTQDDYQFLWKYMSQSPMETKNPAYASDTSLYDSYCKFLMYGDSKKPMPKNIRIFNKVGDAYGFLIDNAYIVDFDKGIEFMLSATIHVNEDGIFNDNKYEYETIGFPFMANLGKVIYDHELKRKRKVKPNLSKFKLQYD